VEERKIHKPRWLEAFLRKIFFNSCSTHPFRKNELNKYCINCNLSVCQYCIASGPHRHHKILKIYRHVYKDVVSLATMEKYIDTSQIQVWYIIWYVFIHAKYFMYNIQNECYKLCVDLVPFWLQPYKCNKRLVISLNPLPHSGSTANNETSCNTCKRKLTEPDLYRYCSISCKVMTIIWQSQPCIVLHIILVSYWFTSKLAG